jgi:hypothetical protein
VGTVARARDRFLRLGGKRQTIIGGGVGVESRFPEVIESTAGADAAKSQDMFRPGYAPEHARLFAASADDGLTASFDDPRTNEEATAAESAIQSKAIALYAFPRRNIAPS